ncbi:shikimate dehydrogenase [Dechloromonas sp.]|uniref:shikimate dehydrogenase n=1 Tax=Dechloromonas sp. TaxID=1917218 RepID=UPI0012265838|nr:shikimate dehydrogenase [Dechloromonas sp.]MBU3695723.1 shikimate dehydrogenase [Dechloromonas sp.]TEX46295.1 MAG: shikimate dehydrogenase [Rhodocyclaceae bacterium]
MSDLYCVFGNPIAHSKSPAIHAAFAAQTGENLRYEARLAAVDSFFAAISAFVAEGGCGANVTVPFKEQAYRRCDRLSDRAARAGAVNTLQFIDGAVHGDNTDGAGLVRDIRTNLGRALAGQRILLLGAGGASRGVIAPLLAEKPAALFIANRSPDKAQQLAAAFAELAAGVELSGGAFAQLAGQQFDVVINATAASLSGDSLPLPAGIFAPGSLAYDMMYGKGETPFLTLARTQGAAHCADGLGMLVEQAAEAFTLWRGKRPETAGVLASLRAALSAQG